MHAGARGPSPGRLPAVRRAFALHAYGDRRGRLGQAIAALGSTYLRHGVVRPNCDPMVFNMNEPLLAGGYHHGRQLDRFTPEGLSAVLAGLPEERVWQSVPQADRFEALAMSEYALSGRIVALYCLRSSIAWQLGMGERVPARALADLGEQIDRIAGQFRTLWLARNKPSRLIDNMRLFRSRSAEARKLARN